MVPRRTIKVLAVCIATTCSYIFGEVQVRLQLRVCSYMWAMAQIRHKYKLALTLKPLTAGLGGRTEGVDYYINEEIQK